MKIKGKGKIRKLEIIRKFARREFNFEFCENLLYVMC